ncbi:hypothetical protein EXU57_21940 [Segetibacter sp. 3557_3]|uniref:hypothetical protein n=1 Tax=Segetibacter sp. 3557_3 TaxID=2547429 RepID=UPI001058F497|nr:hypothetical protein [Segetibacter sp. 3557_3]TDH19944.1 hypothetical protein EXU57_21940 [Segetibacter sp. 3557_3]
MPVLLLFLILTELCTIGIVFFGIHLFREWYLWKDTLDDEYALRCLYGALALTAYSLLGKFPVSWILSKSHKDEDEPTQEHSKNS